MKLFTSLKLPFAVFLIVYFLYLVLNSAPAAWAAWIAHSAAPNVWLNNVEGTLWRGKALSTQVDINKKPIALGELRWELKPWSLLLLKPCADISINLPKQSIEGRVCQGFSGTQLKNFNVDMPVAVLKEAFDLEATGAISLQVIEASLKSDMTITSLDARVTWQNARAFVAENWINFGTFAAKANDDGNGGVRAEIFDIESPYKTALDANWKAGSPAKVVGTIAPQKGASDLVLQGLQILGEDMGEGVYKVQWP